MLAKNEIEAASHTLHQHWRAGAGIGRLDDAMRPRDRAESVSGV